MNKNIHGAKGHTMPDANVMLPINKTICRWEPRSPTSMETVTNNLFFHDRSDVNDDDNAPNIVNALIIKNMDCDSGCEDIND